LHGELALAIRGMEVEMRLNADRQKLLEDQFAAAAGRLNSLAEIRAPYETQTAENRSRTVLAERASKIWPKPGRFWPGLKSPASSAHRRPRRGRQTHRSRPDDHRP